MVNFSDEAMVPNAPKASSPQPDQSPIATGTNDDLGSLLAILPQHLRTLLEQHPRREQLIEVVLDLGRRAEARFPGEAQYLTETMVSRDELNYCIERVGYFGGDNRAGIEQTLHRISAIRNRSGEVVGLTCRVGRAVFGTIGMIRDLVETGRSILMLGRPGVGKTTALREIARVLADDFQKRVVIIDTSNEIAGDGDIPHPAIGRARRMQVAKPELQHQVMIEAVENHMPEVIVIDEIGTELEATAARTIAERGVQLVGTAHGNRLENLIKNPTLSDLVGGVQSVTLGDDEARRRGSQKSVLERKAPPTFEIAIEMSERQRWVVHEDVATTIDSLLRGRQPGMQVRSTDSDGQVAISHEAPETPLRAISNRSDRTTVGFAKKGWRASGHMTPLSTASPSEVRRVMTPEEQHFQHLLDVSEPTMRAIEVSSPFTDPLSLSEEAAPEFGPNGEEILRLYPYGISRHHLEHVIRTLHLPVTLTKDLELADAVLALRSHIKSHSKLRHVAKTRQLPIHTVKSNGIPQIVRSLQRLLDPEEGSTPANINLNLFSQGEEANELEALEEARLAVEQIVIPKGQPVELLPRSSRIRKMQHELAEHYHLKSLSFGDEPNRRLRIYPA
ncbi:MAG: AAA family ATPase [Cyanobacteria bacterium]|nr:AAA family ATPase [Cyanobacteriota bacterium]MDA0866168.1 AAA family ATPase [Cyanobacteriota bacterium]